MKPSSQSRTNRNGAPISRWRMPSSRTGSTVSPLIAPLPTPSVRQAPDLDELEAERLDAVDDAVQLGLVADLPVQDGLDALAVALEHVEALEHRLAQAAADAELVLRRGHGHGRGGSDAPRRRAVRRLRRFGPRLRGGAGLRERVAERLLRIVAQRGLDDLAGDLHVGEHLVHVRLTHERDHGRAAGLEL